ncbi:MAG: hypothetical protein QCH99_08230 [Candidatus Bathyarchaeota archaeon]|nr:hypothetical protein [Candidatus Bathyarchaeum tardum]
MARSKKTQARRLEQNMKNLIRIDGRRIVNPVDFNKIKFNAVCLGAYI